MFLNGILYSLLGIGNTNFAAKERQVMSAVMTVKKDGSFGLPFPLHVHQGADSTAGRGALDVYRAYNL